MFTAVIVGTIIFIAIWIAGAAAINNYVQKDLADEKCIIALVGNKLDIVQNNEKKREVSKEEAKSFAYLNHLLFYETSALNDENIGDIFEEILQNIYNERRKVTSRTIDKNNANIQLNVKDQKYCYFMDDENGDNKCNC